MSYELIYFNGRGRAEVARWIFAAAGETYTDTRLEKEKWAEIKPTTPFGQLPVLKVDGDFQISQSGAIAIFLAKRFGLAGKGEKDEARVHMVCFCIEDMVQVVAKMIMGTNDESKREATEKWNASGRQETLDKFHTLLSSNKSDSGYFVGDSMTVADIAFCQVSEHLNKDPNLDWSKFPKLAALNQKVVKDNKNIADWIAKRPESTF